MSVFICFSNIILFYWFRSFTYCTLIAFISQSSQFHPYLPLWPPQKKRKKKYQVRFVLPIYSLEQGQTPSGQPLKENWVPPYPHPCQKPLTVESYTLASLLQFLRVVLNDFLSRLFLYWRKRGGGLSTSLPCLSFSTVSLQSSTPLQRNSFALYRQQQHRSCSSTRFLVAVHTIYISPVLAFNMDHGPHHGSQWQHRSLTPT